MTALPPAPGPQGKDAFDPKALGQRVKARRHERGLTQKQLAEIAGLTRPCIAQIEIGSWGPTAYTLFRLCQALNCRAEDLWGV